MKNLYFLLLVAVLTMFSQTSYSQQWLQIGEDIDGEAADDQSGNSIDISADGNIIAIGAFQNDNNGIDAGNVRILENVNGIWTQIGNDIEGEAGEKKGFAVSLNDAGNIVALSTPYVEGNTGKVSIYKNIDGIWTQMGDDILGKGPGYYSGVSIDLSADGNQIAISNHANVGYIRIYNYESSTWSMTAEITGTLYNEQLGGSGLKFNDDATLLAARPSSGTYHPFVRVFKKNGEGDWEQVGDTITEARSAFSISRDGTTVAAGTRGYYSGEVYVYENIDDSWTPKGDTINLPHPAVGYSLFTQLSSDGNMLVVGQPGDANGLVLTYIYREGQWVKSDFEYLGEANDDNFGLKMSLSFNDSILAISAPHNDGNGVNSGHVRVYNYFECATITEDVSLSICENDLPYTFGTQTLTESGEYTETFTTANSCDSTVTLHLSTTPTYNDTISEIINKAETPYVFGSQSLDSSGVYTENFVTINGCDSLVTINLTVNITGYKIIDSRTESIIIYPNPSSGIVYIRLEDQSLKSIQVSVYDLSMRQVSMKTVTTDQLIKLDLSYLPGGQYITTIKTDDDIITRKITLNE